MSYHREWVIAGTCILVVMSEEVIRTISQYVQNDAVKDEAGGILLGIRRNDHFEVIYATEPTKFDVRSRTHWQRSEKIHEDIAIKRWQESKGKVTYLGEWHTHPENIPSPSMVDINEWNKLSSKCSYRAGLAMIIVGIDDLWCGVVQRKNSVLSMSKIS